MTAPHLSVTDAASRRIEELSRRLASAERENGEMLKLVVASRRLGESTTTPDALAAIHDIIATVIGSEDFAIYLLEPDGMLRWVRGMGTFGDVVRHLTLTDEPIGTAVASRALFVPESVDDALDRPRTVPLAAVVPFVLGDHLLGALAIFRPLPHRDPITMQADGEILRLVGAQAAAALALGNLLSPEPAASSHRVRA